MQIIKTHLILLFLIFCFSHSGHGQSSGNYRLIVTSEGQRKLEDSDLHNIFKSHVNNQSTLNQWMNKIYEEGYLLASYEQSKNDSTGTIIKLDLGKRFTWAELKKGNFPDELLSKTGYKQNFFEQHIVNFKKISSFFEATIRYAERNGYPFASIKLNSLFIEDEKLSAELEFDLGPYITFDSLKLLNNNKIKNRFLEAYLKIKPHTPYDQKKIDNIPNLINTIPYLSIIEAPLLYFANEKCQITLNLQDEKVSAFDGIIGFLPNENDEGKLLVTGQLYLKIENLFRSGKKLELDWRKINVQSQEMNLTYEHPAVLRAPLDFGISFNLYKQDTTFITRKLGVNLFYNNHNSGRIGLHYDRNASRLLKAESLDISGMPSFADYNLNYYGIVYKYNSLDHPIFPSRGWELIMAIDIGTKSIIKNANLADDLYEDIPDEGLQWQSTMILRKFFRLRPRNILLIKVDGGYMNGNHLFLNDLFRLGGLNSLRGFNDMFFYASRYAIGTLEYRYLFENESQLLVFFDASVLGHTLNDEAYNDFPIGTGLGINISTKAGLLNVIYGIGRSADQPLNLKYSKIHIGYTGRF